MGVEKPVESCFTNRSGSSAPAEPLGAPVNFAFRPWTSDDVRLYKSLDGNGAALVRSAELAHGPKSLPELHDDDVLVRLASERLVQTFGKPVEVVEETVRDELAKWRSTARIQTFVPILAERSARNRLAS
jgi:Protein-tyrosine-phosphatase-like, N-terminal domain